MIWEFFRFAEFDSVGSPGSAEKFMSVDLINRLEYAREAAGIPFVITSGYRTKEHNEAVGGVPGSSHCKGLAADIATRTSTDRYLILSALIAEGFTRVGIGPDFLHVDEDPTKAHGVCWLY